MDDWLGWLVVRLVRLVGIIVRLIGWFLDARVCMLLLLLFILWLWLWLWLLLLWWWLWLLPG